MKNYVPSLLVSVAFLAVAFTSCCEHKPSKPSKPLTQAERLIMLEDELLDEFRSRGMRDAEDFVKFAEAIDKLRKAYTNELQVRQEK